MRDFSEHIFARLNAWAGFAAITEVMSKVSDVGFYIAGGVVRDAYLQWPHAPKDFDIFLEGVGVDRVVEMLAQHGSVVSGAFGSPEWSPRDAPETDCDIIPVERFFNGLWRCRDMVDALNQFDCTANAVAIDLRTGFVLDPQNGRRDLAQRTMRAVRFDYPDEPIAVGTTLTRKAVVWWRLLHYAAARNLTVEPVTRQWLRANRLYEASRGEFERVFYCVQDKVLTPLSGA